MNATDLGPEEPWESDFARMLGDLPTIDPPEGFLRSVVDRRPPGSLRTIGAVLAVTVVGATVLSLAGPFGSRMVEPPISEFTAAHTRVAGALPTGSSDESPLFELPAGYEPMAATWDGATDARHDLFRGADDSVSVFVQRGELDPASRPGGATPLDLDGLDAWEYAEDGLHVAVVEAADRVTTVIGSDAAEVRAVAAELPGPVSGLEGRLRRTLADLTAELGFAELP